MPEASKKLPNLCWQLPRATAAVQKLRRGFAGPRNAGKRARLRPELGGTCSRLVPFKKEALLLKLPHRGLGSKDATRRLWSHLYTQISPRLPRLYR